MISKPEYIKFKEMYDYKRKIEYNKEKTKKRINEMFKEFNILGGTKEEVFDHFWSNVDYNTTESVSYTHLTLPTSVTV